jgi:hypothetical protein
MAGFLASSLLFLGSVALLGLLGWQLLDEWAGNVRPLRRAYRLSPARCWRCRGSLDGDRCTRCRARSRRLVIRVADERREFAVDAAVAYGSYLRQTVVAGDGSVASFLTPSVVPARLGDEVALVLDSRGRLRAFENVTLDSGWRMPTRIVGGRSPFAFAGLVFLVPAAFGVLFAAPLYFLVSSVVRGEHLIARLGGGAAPADSGLGSAQSHLFMWIAYLLLAVLVGGLILQLRRRPPINRRVVGGS